MCNLRRKKEKPYSFLAYRAIIKSSAAHDAPSRKKEEEKEGRWGVSEMRGKWKTSKKKRIAARGALGNILADLKAAGNGLPAYSNAPAGRSSPIEVS